MKTWLITGCSTGLGRSLAEAVLRAGDNVVVTARNVQSVQHMVADWPATAVAVALDVTRQAQIDDALNVANTRFGGIDILVNNAGHGYRAAVEEGDEQEVSDLFAANFFGAVSLIKKVLPGMRAKRQGFIVNISSIAGRLAMPGSGYYSATKFALEGLSDALRKEVAPLGIGVMVVDPGAFRTEFAGHSLQQAKALIADYASTSGPRRKENDNTHGTQQGDPERAAKVIIQAVTSESPPFRLLMGSDAVWIVTEELNSQRNEIDQWETLSVSTDFPVEN